MRINRLKEFFVASLTSGFIFLGSSPVWAQISFGARLGMNISTADVMPQSTLDYRWQNDWFAGGIVTVVADAPVGGQVEVLYSRRGTAFEVPSTDTLNGKFKLSFIDIPLLVRVRAVSLTTGGVFLLAGPTVGIGVGAKVEQGADSVEIDDRFKKYDLSLTFGVAFESSGAILDARYAHGISNYANGTHPAAQEFKGRTLALAVGFRF
jgi:hypothetical protein